MIDECAELVFTEDFYEHCSKVLSFIEIQKANLFLFHEESLPIHRFLNLLSICERFVFEWQGYYSIYVITDICSQNYLCR